MSELHDEREIVARVKGKWDREFLHEVLEGGIPSCVLADMLDENKTDVDLVDVIVITLDIIDNY